MKFFKRSYWQFIAAIIGIIIVVTWYVYVDETSVNQGSSFTFNFPYWMWRN
jgi:hypothetical protein